MRESERQEDYPAQKDNQSFIFALSDNSSLWRPHVSPSISIRPLRKGDVKGGSIFYVIQF